MEVVIADDLSPDEAICQVGVDFAGAFDRVLSPIEAPSPAFILADREKDDLIHGVINVPKDLVARGTGQTQIAHEDLAIFGAKLFQLQLQFRGCGQSFGRQLQ